METLRNESSMSTLFAPSGGGSRDTWDDLDKSSNAVPFGPFVKAAAAADAAYASGDAAALDACLARGAGANKVTEWKPTLCERFAMPPWFDAMNWLGCLERKAHRGVFKPKLALMQAGACTSQHRDNYGTTTWIKALGGSQLLATWSMADGDANAGFGDDVLGHGESAFDWRGLLALPSARLALVEAGDFFLMRPGTYHRVFTLRPKVQLFGEFVTGASFVEALASASADARRPDCLKACEKGIAMRDIFLGGLRSALAAARTTPAIDAARAALRGTKGDAALTALRWLGPAAADAASAAAGVDVDAAAERLLAARL